MSKPVFRCACPPICHHKGSAVFQSLTHTTTMGRNRKQFLKVKFTATGAQHFHLANWCLPLSYGFHFTLREKENFSHIKKVNLLMINFWTGNKSYFTFHFAQISASFSIPRTKWHFHVGCIAIVTERDWNAEQGKHWGGWKQALQFLLPKEAKCWSAEADDKLNMLHRDRVRVASPKCTLHISQDKWGFFVQCFIVFKYTLICFMQFLQHSINSSAIKGNPPCFLQSQNLILSA